MCDECNYEDYLEEMEMMSADEAYEFAWDTIGGIYDWVEEKEHITEAQIRAIANIRDSVH